jgi:hypothetical protein
MKLLLGRLIVLVIIFSVSLIFVFAIIPDENDVIILSNANVINIKGGSAVKEIFKPDPLPSIPTTYDIKLGNIPYVYQESGTTDYDSYRSLAYCGLASALMVRSKVAYGTNAPVMSHSEDYQWMKTIDSWLNNNADKRHIDIYPTGLVFTDGQSYLNFDKFTYTVNILNEIYTTNHNNNRTFYHSKNTHRVSSLNAHVVLPENAINLIWNHILNNHQPVVVISDSALLSYYYLVNINSKTSYPTALWSRELHYMVIAGIRDTNGFKEFYTYDPLSAHGIRYYKEDQLKDFITLSYSTIAAQSKAQWVFDYTLTATGYKGCYVMLINGS